MLNKKNNWLRLKTDFFQSLALKKIRKIAGGDTYLIIYQKLMLLTVNTEGHYEMQGLEPTIEEELALILDEEIYNIRVTLSLIRSLKLIDDVNDKTIYFNQVPQFIGKYDDSAKRVAEYRERQKLSCNALQSLQVTECNALDNKENKKDNDNKKDNINIIIDHYCQKTCRPKTTDKAIIKNINEVLKNYTIDDCKKVIDFIIVDKWYKDNGYDTLSSIFKPTKFGEKFERALVYKPNIADKLKNISQQDFNTGGVF